MQNLNHRVLAIRFISVRGIAQILRRVALVIFKEVTQIRRCCATTITVATLVLGLTGPWLHFGTNHPVRFDKFLVREQQQKFPNFYINLLRE